MLSNLAPVSSLLMLLAHSAIAASVFIVMFITVGLTQVERRFIYSLAMRIKSRGQSLPLTEETTHA